MKREMLRILVALVLVLSLATVASADTVISMVRHYGSYFQRVCNSDGIPDLNQKRISQPANSLSPGMEIILGHTALIFIIHISGSQSATPVSIPDKGANFVLAAYLLDTWRSQADTTKESAALQAAVWKAIYGDRFTLLATTDDVVEAFYDTYTVALPAPDGFTGANYTFLDLYQVGESGNVVRQGLITGVPEPMTMLLLGLGLVGLAGLRRKE